MMTMEIYLLGLIAALLITSIVVQVVAVLETRQLPDVNREWRKALKGLSYTAQEEIRKIGAALETAHRANVVALDEDSRRVLVMLANQIERLSGNLGRKDTVR